MNVTKKSPQEQFSELALRYHLGLLSYSRAIEDNEAAARELLQDAFVAAWKSFDRFEPSLDFSSWMRGIIRNKRHERSRRYRKEVPLDDAILDELDRTMQHHAEGDQALFERLNHCRQALPEAMGEAIKLFYDEERSSQEVADALQINASALRKRLERARDALRICLGKQL